MNRILFLAILLLPNALLAEVFVLGSSFSWDGRPPLLRGSNAWHIDCGRTLQYIWDEPASPCESSSSPWTGALAIGSYDFISFQPVPGTDSTREADVAAISAWMAMQPKAVGVIHPTWGRPELFHTDFHDPNPNHSLTNNSREYYDLLVEELRQANPGRVFFSDRGNEMLDGIYHDVEDGVGPITDFMQLFRDLSGHMSFDLGRYLMHNALRQAFGQPVGVDPESFGIDAEAKTYLDGVVRAFAPQILPAVDPTPEGTGVVHFKEKTRVGRGCERERVLRTAGITLSRGGTFLLEHPGVDLSGAVRKLDRKGRRWALDLDEASVAAYLDFLRTKAEGLCGAAETISVTAERGFEIRYHEGDGRLLLKVRSRGHAQMASGDERLEHKIKGRTIAWQSDQAR